MAEFHERFKNYTDGIQSVVVAACAILTLIWGYYQFTALLSKQTANADYQNKLLTNQLGSMDLREKKPVIDVEVKAKSICIPELNRTAIFIDALVKNAGSITATMDLTGIPYPKNQSQIYPFRVGAYTPRNGQHDEYFRYLESIPVKSVERDLWSYVISPNGYKHLYALADVQKSGTYFIDFEAPASHMTGEGQSGLSGNYYGSTIMVFHSTPHCAHP